MNEDRDKKQEFKIILPNLRNRPRRLLSIYPKNDCNIELTWFNYKNRIRSHESAIIRRLDKRVSLWLKRPRLQNMIIVMMIRLVTAHIK